MHLKTLVHEHFNHNLISRHWSAYNSITKDQELKETLIINETLEIKKFTLNELEKCAELYLKVFTSSPWYDMWISTVQVQDYLKELIFNPVFEGFIVCKGDDVVAVCLGHRRSWWKGKELFIDEFFVANEFQGNGMGSQLINFMWEYLSQEDYQRFILTTNKGIPAQEFYLKNGFKNNDDRIIMVKDF